MLRRISRRSSLLSPSLPTLLRISLVACALALPGDRASAVPLEVGTITVSSSWSVVVLSESFTNPVVVPSLPTTGAGTDAVLQVRNVTSSSFQVRLVAPSSGVLSPGTTQEAGWLAVESGTHTVGSTTIAAGLIPGVPSLLDSDPANFASVALPGGFSSAPAVLGATQTTSIFGDDFIVARARDVTSSGFDIGFQREESLESIPHPAETIGWIAWETGTETVGDWVATAAVTPDSVTHTPSSFAFAGFDPGTELEDGSVFGLLNGFDGVDPAWVGGAAPVGTTVDIFVDEDAWDGETSHTTEPVALLAFAPVPEPGTASLLSLTLLGMALRRPRSGHR